MILNLFIGTANIINFWFNAREWIWVPFINISLAVFLLIGMSGISKKIKALKKEQIIHE